MRHHDGQRVEERTRRVRTGRFPSPFLFVPYGAIALLLSAAGAACGPGDTGATPDAASRVEAVLDKADPERLLRYYLSGYVAPQGGDPVEAGLLVKDGRRLYIDTDVLARLHPGMGDRLRQASSNGRVDWDGFEAFLLGTYYAARRVPPTLEAFRDSVAYGGEDWFRVDLDGVMTTARRRVYVRKEALRYALRHYRERGDALIYPVGTAFVGDHLVEGERTETTVMRKRGDDAWDFFTYGRDGALTTETEPRPRALKTPTQCVGCHFGQKAFEPARSFPATVPDGPHGPRAYYLDERLRDGDVVAFFDEHRKRSDRVLGLYNTLFVTGLRAERTAGRLDAADAALLAQLGL